MVYPGALVYVNRFFALGGEVGAGPTRFAVDLQIRVPGRQPVSLPGPRAEAFSLVMFEQTGSANQILHILTDPIVPDPLVVLVHMALHGYFLIKALFE